MLTGILHVAELPPQSTFWRFLASLHRVFSARLRDVVGGIGSVEGEPDKGEENRHGQGCGGRDSGQVAAGSTKTGAMAEWTSRAIAAAGNVVYGGRGGGTGAWRISHR
jgi:hypothetical protein